MTKGQIMHFSSVLLPVPCGFLIKYIQYPQIKLLTISILGIAVQ